MGKPYFTYSINLKTKLLQKGYLSLKDWCDKMGFPYRLAQKVVTLRTPAKDGKASEIKEALIEEFGEEVFDPPYPD